jgi:hypothetical protein
MTRKKLPGYSRKSETEGGPEADAAPMVDRM